MACVLHALIFFLFYFIFKLLVGSQTKSIQNGRCGLQMKNSYRLPHIHGGRHVLAHPCSLSGSQQICRNCVLMGEEEREEHVYVRTCHKYAHVCVRVYIHIYTRGVVYGTDHRSKRRAHIACQRKMMKPIKAWRHIYSDVFMLHTSTPVATRGKCSFLGPTESSRSRGKSGGEKRGWLRPNLSHVPPLSPGAAPAGLF